MNELYVISSNHELVEWCSTSILFYSLYLKLKIHHLRNKLAGNSETSSYFRTIRLWPTFLTHAWKCISLCISLSLILIRCWFVDINQGKSIYLKGMKGMKCVINIPGTIDWNNDKRNRGKLFLPQSGLIRLPFFPLPHFMKQSANS